MMQHAPNDPLPTTRRWIPWILLYLVLVAAIVGGMLRARRQAVAASSTPEYQQAWEDWRTEVKKLAEAPGAVRRRVPQSPEPPGLVLLRDHFPACLLVCLVTSTALYATTVILIRGAIETSRNHEYV